MYPPDNPREKGAQSQSAQDKAARTSNQQGPVKHAELP